MSLSVLGLIPARAGSKGVPGKNIRPLAGRPLLYYAADAARESGVIDRLVLSTDSPEIAALAHDAGVEVPFLRPAALAQDDTAMLPVVQHALGALAAHGSSPDVVVPLQLTSPVRRRAELIRSAVALLRDTKADSVVSVVQLPQHVSPDYVMRLENGRLSTFLPEGARITRRQDARVAYVREGAVYAFRRSTVERYGDIYGNDCRALIIEPHESITIDSPEEWDAAERALLQQ